MEIENLLGKDPEFVVANVEAILKDALLTDPRITRIVDVETEVNSNNILVTFKVYSIYGTFDMGYELLI